MTRRSWIGVHDEVPQKRQCVLASVVRCTVYTQRKPKTPSEGDQVLKRLIDEVDLGFCQYTRYPCYGSSKMVVYLRRCGQRVNRKRAQRLLRSMGLAGMARCCGGAREPGVAYPDITYTLMATQIPPLVATSNSPTLSAVRCRVKTRCFTASVSTRQDVTFTPSLPEGKPD
ncbi:MAG: transposase, partial [Candidatus Saccharibacteria bacterium]|nr:transposase [Rhodoferax sp.]